MAHKAQIQFCTRIRDRFPERFRGVRVLDVGSFDINGNNRYLFEDFTYLGIDLMEGPNVDLVTKAHELAGQDGSHDFVISTECLEHDMYYEESLRNMVRLLRPGGMLLFTCATTGRREHGTRRTTPGDSPPTVGISDEWADYYKNLTEADIRAAIDPDVLFSEYEFMVNRKLFDLYFWGKKRIAS